MSQITREDIDSIGLAQSYGLPIETMFETFSQMGSEIVQDSEGKRGLMRFVKFITIRNIGSYPESFSQEMQLAEGQTGIVYYGWRRPDQFWLSVEMDQNSGMRWRWTGSSLSGLDEQLDNWKLPNRIVSVTETE